MTHIVISCCIIIVIIVLMLFSYDKGLDDGMKLMKGIMSEPEPDIIEQQQGCPAKEITNEFTEKH